VNAFDRLHPALQHHIVNSLGWRNLRPLQEQAIDPVLAGDDVLLIAPTASGKTEAAVFPVLSRMLAERWMGLGVLYVCPLKALLNSLAIRLQGYARLIGRRVEVWHGDVMGSQRAKIGREPPDLLLATPESLEVMLVSRRLDHWTFFINLRTIIIDELHAFAGDDRGWHLLGVLARIAHLAGRDLQRIGLSATIGNPQQLIDWLCADGKAPRHVIHPPSERGIDADVQLDYVGSLSNAALVISRLHRGEKRLVFCDSRARVEELVVELRKRGVETFVSHSSLSHDERQRAEAAFAGATDCVIVATSTLELGIDVGDLDRVIQIDAPYTVSSFLQRLGRSGRRRGQRRNCLFLTTTDEAFLRAAALLHLWKKGYVEPVVPPPLPYHILAQQLMALSLQEGGIGRATWRDWIGSVSAFAQVSPDEITAIIQHIVCKGILFEEEGILAMGHAGEQQFSYRNFLEFFSVFSSPPLVRVFCGQSEIGQVHELTFHIRDEAPTILTLAGRGWVVNYIDWPRRRAYVEPTDLAGRSRWVGAAQPMHITLCQAVAEVLGGAELAVNLSKRAHAKLQEARAEHPWVETGSTALIQRQSGVIEWWNFAGRLLNTAVARHFGGLDLAVSFDQFKVVFQGSADITSIRLAIEQLVSDALPALEISPSKKATSELKFTDCVPDYLLTRMLASRLDPSSAFEVIRAHRVRPAHVF
jgi:ATP-dependent helicase Lhr and Lhr-like helicase